MVRTLKKPAASATLPQRQKPRLELVLKCDTVGSMEAITGSLEALSSAEVDVGVVHRGIGNVGKSDVLFAGAASRLIVGFQVGVLQSVDKTLKEQKVEVRLYEVIYRLLADVEELARSLIPRVPEEQVIGSARVIALFKSTRKGIIVGCEVGEGFLAVGERFRIYSAMGPVYAGIIESLHIGKAQVRKATPGQQVGLRIKDFNRAKIGDLVESFRPPASSKTRAWEPTGRIVRK